MKRMSQWVLTLLCGLTLFTSCKDSDNPITPPDTQGKLVTLPQGVVSKGYTMQTARIVNTTDGEITVYEKKNVQVAFDGQDVYVSGFSSSFPESFVKGTLTGAGTCLFKSGQYVGEDKTGEKYVVGIMDTGNKANQLTDFECTYDPEMRTMTIPEDAKFAVAESETPSHTQVSNIMKNVTVMPGSIKEPSVVTLPEGLATEQWYVTGSDDKDFSLNYGLTIGFDGQDVYIQGLFKQMPLSWVHGRLEGGVITIEKGQFVGYFRDWQEVLLVGYDEELNIGDITMTFDADKRIMEYDNFIGFYGTDTRQVEYGFGEAYITKERYIVPDPILPPAGMSASPYRFEYVGLVKSDEGDFLVKDVDGIEEVFIGFDGNDVYFKHSYIDANGWVKGTFSPDHRTITIPSLQFFGWFQREGGVREDYYATGIVEKAGGIIELTDFVLEYDAQQDIISSCNTMCFCTSYRLYNPYIGCIFQNPVFTKKKEVAATPAAPGVDMNYNSMDRVFSLVLMIPLVTDDGIDLLTNKLSYIIYYEKDGEQHEMVFRTADYEGLEADMVEIPYNLEVENIVRAGADIYLNKPLDELLTWTRIGAKLIYRGGGEEHASDITWFDAASFYQENELIK